MKSVLIAIRPQWAEKIAKGIKTIEVRKTAPQEVPFKAYIYESRNGGHRCKHCNEKDSCYSYAPKNVGCYNGSGKVICEFICDKVMVLTPLGLRGFEIHPQILNAVCLTKEDLDTYGGLKTIYGWHISDLKIYDKPKELREFKTSCNGCKERDTYHCKFYCYGERPLTRPPQSYMYVRELCE